jgi:prepilin-type N-terminal cleavage/methylation domain-containing protein
MNRVAANIARNERGYSIVELLISLVISLIILSGATALYTGALQTRERESGRVDALTAAQAALSVMSREIGNAGYGLDDNNGLVLADCNGKQIRVRANVQNTDSVTSGAGEDIMYFYDSASKSVVRYDRRANGGAGLTSGIINRVSDVDFEYHNYNDDGTSVIGSPATNTAKVTIKLKVLLPDVVGQPSGKVEQVTSDVTLRNAPYVLGRY